MTEATLKGERLVPAGPRPAFLGRPVWTARPHDADRFLAYQRKDLGRSRLTVQRTAWSLAHFFNFLLVRYQGDIYALTGCVVEQVIDEFNRPAHADYGVLRVPPSGDEVDQLFGGWRDWRRDLGEHGKIHIRFGKGSKGRGPKSRLAPAINQADALLDWWMAEVRHQFGDDWQDPDAPLLPPECRDEHTGFCRRVGDQALHDGLAFATGRWLPGWEGRLSPHTLRHYCASSLYARGMNLTAIQELLGHSWLSITTRYIHVESGHIEHQWALANERTAARLGQYDDKGER
jgi:hypothetical protein